MRPDDSIDDLDTRIALAEMRLVARQNRLRTQVSALGMDVRSALRPQRLLMPAAAGAGGLLGVLGLWRLVRGRKPGLAAVEGLGALAALKNLHVGQAASARALAVRQAGRVLAGVPWMRLLSLATSMMPMARRLLARVQQARAATAGWGNADPADEGHAGGSAAHWPGHASNAGRGRRRQAANTRVATLDLWDASPAVALDAPRWAGRWLEVAATPARRASRTPLAVDVHYLVRSDGCFDYIRRSVDPDGRLRTIRAVVRPAGDRASGHADGSASSSASSSTGGSTRRETLAASQDSRQTATQIRMEISHWPSWLQGLPLAWDEHSVLHVDADYGAALVGRQDGGAFSLLVRGALARDLAPERAQSLVRLARERGLDVSALRFAGTTPATRTTEPALISSTTKPTAMSGREPMTKRAAAPAAATGSAAAT